MTHPALTPAEVTFLAAVVDRYCKRRGIIDGGERASMAASAFSYYRQGLLAEHDLAGALDAKAIILRINEI